MVVAHSWLRPWLGTIPNHLNVFPCFLHSTYVAHGRRFLLMMIPRSSLSVIHVTGGLALACPALCAFIFLFFYFNSCLAVHFCELGPKRTEKKRKGASHSTGVQGQPWPGRDPDFYNLCCSFLYSGGKGESHLVGGADSGG